MIWSRVRSYSFRIVWLSWCLLLINFTGPAVAGDPGPTFEKEVAHLFEYLKTSPCEFNRNGTWYKADTAVAHLHRKYEYFRNRGLITSTEDFIEKAATGSSISGTPYLIRCGNENPVKLNARLNEELARYRKSSR
jgi:hypothetical protein